MRAGRLDRVITFRKPTITKGTTGSPKQTFADYLIDVPAMVIPLKGRERVAADQKAATWDVAFRVRYHSDLDKPEVYKYQIRYQDKDYDIQHIAEVNRREALEILATVRK